MAFNSVAQIAEGMGLRSPWVQLPLGFASFEAVFAPAHNVKIKPAWTGDKWTKPPDGEWRDVWPSLPEVAEHVARGGIFGSVPYTLTLPDGTHLSALDVDRGDVAVLASPYPPLVAVPSWREGGYHCYYPDSEPRGNSTWSLGDVGGEVRSANGYAAHYRTGPLELAEAVAQWPNGGYCVPFPAHLCSATTGGKSTSKRGKSTSKGKHGQQRLIAPPAGLTPLLRLRDVPEGQRHTRLVWAACRWAGRRTWNGRDLDDDWLIRHLWRLAIGMDNRLPEDEVAGIVGWCVSMRPLFRAMPHTPQWLATQAARGKRGGLVSRGGGRPRTWASEADRLRAYRASHRTETSQ